MSALVIMVSLLLAVPPLTENQRTQLESTDDRSPLLDEAAWYPLIEHALAWEPGDEAGAAVPDYAELLANPQTSRGDLFLIEGQLARAQPVGLARPGAWGDTLTEWTIVVDANDPEDRADDTVAVVYLVDPAGEFADTADRSAVRVPTRFYKVWSDRDATGAATDYLTFVGRHPTVVREGPVRVDRSEVAATVPWWLMIPVLVFLLVGLVLVKQMVRPAATRAHGVARRDRERRHGGEELQSIEEAPLPQDPAEALQEMEQRGR